MSLPRVMRSNGQVKSGSLSRLMTSLLPRSEGCLGFSDEAVTMLTKLGKQRVHGHSLTITARMTGQQKHLEGPHNHFSGGCHTRHAWSDMRTEIRRCLPPASGQIEIRTSKQVFQGHHPTVSTSRDHMHIRH